LSQKGIVAGLKDSFGGRREGVKKMVIEFDIYRFIAPAGRQVTGRYSRIVF
jgi:hypothetical protein